MKFHSSIEKYYLKTVLRISPLNTQSVQWFRRGWTRGCGGSLLVYLPPDVIASRTVVARVKDFVWIVSFEFGVVVADDAAADRVRVGPY